MKLTLNSDITRHISGPALIAGWHGMGNVGLGGISYIRRKLKAKPFGEIDTSEYVTPDAVVVADGLVEFPELPANSFYFSKEPNLVFFESDTQIHGSGGVTLMGQILDLAEALKVDTIYTGAAFAMPVSHKEQVKVQGVANDKELRDFLVEKDVKILPEGKISGMNGLLLGFAGLRNIKAACLMATIPAWAMQLPNPKASRALIQSLDNLLTLNIDQTEIDRAVEQMEQPMEKIEGQIQMIFSEQKQEELGEEWKRIEEDKVPEYVMEKIENLFVQVRSQESRQGSRKKAAELKNELDRWDLYTLYEDRFLELFR